MVQRSGRKRSFHLGAVELLDTSLSVNAAARGVLAYQSPNRIFKNGSDRVEIWDADDFDPWDTLEWKTVRVIHYRQHKPDGTIIEAQWLTNFSTPQVGSEPVTK